MISVNKPNSRTRYVNAAIAIAPCAHELSSDINHINEMQLFPAGPFRARDGRPEEVPHWFIAGRGEKIIARAAERQTPIPVDYDHQIIHSKDNGQRAPRAGGFLQLEWRDGKGLYAVNIDWTERARGYIAAREYLYVSPVFIWDIKTGEVLEILMAAITNDPALDGMDELTLRAAARFDYRLINNNGETVMLSKLIALLGLKTDADEDAAVAAVTALKAQAAQSVEHENKVAQLTAQLAGTKTTTPDPAKFVPVEAVTALQTQVAELSARIGAGIVDKLIDDALQAGKLLPAMEDWARKLGAHDVAQLKAYIDAAPVIAALNGTQTGGKTPDAKPGELSAAEIALCTQMGLSQDDYKKVNNISGGA